jgi:predicted GNAT family acetyltransferase
MQGWRLGGEVWGWYEGDVLVSAAYNGANLVTVEATDAALFAFADRARRFGRRCSSLVGPADEILELWRLLEPSWGPARDVRSRQPVMVASAAPSIAPDPLVRAVREEEIDALLPASVAMFTEEVGVPPSAGESMHVYRARVAELVRAGRAFARFDDGRVVFKAEVGAVSAGACQVQGVWVAPELRGRGLAAPGMAAVVEQTIATIAPVVSLYVNDYNTAARRTYRAVGFTEVDVFASVLF